MLLTISEKSKLAFESAATDLGIPTDLPGTTGIRPDLALYITAVFMLAVIIEAGKDGKIYDITNHDVRKYEPWHTAEEGYEPGSSGGGFSYFDSGSGGDDSSVGARLSSNSPEEVRKCAEDYPDLWEIFILYVK